MLVARVFTKICGIGTAEDLRAAIDAGADAVGFIAGTTHHSEDKLSTDQARTLAAGVPGPIAKVLVTHLLDADAILDLAHAVGVDTVQVHGEVSAATMRDIWVRRGALRIIQTIHVTGDSALDAAMGARDFCHAVLLDTRTESRLGGTGLTHDWGISRRICDALRAEAFPAILAGGLDAENVSSAIRAVRPYGVDANSRLKDAAGRKDRVSCRDFVHAATDTARR